MTPDSQIALMRIDNAIAELGQTKTLHDHHCRFPFTLRVIYLYSKNVVDEKNISEI